MLFNFQNRAYKKALTARLDGSQPGLSLPSGDAAERCFNKATFTLMGCLTGLSNQQYAYPPPQVVLMLQILGLTSQTQEQAAVDFRAGSLPVTDVMQIVEQWIQHVGRRSKLAELFLRLQCQASLLKGHLALQEKRMLRDVAECCGFSKAEFLEICAGVQSPVGGQDALGLLSPSDAYQVLQLKPGATEAEIRRAFLRQISTCHPDKLLAYKLPDAALSVARDKFTAVNAAYLALSQADQRSA